MPPNTPTLAVSDHADGSGATASVAGSTPGAVNDLAVQPVAADAWLPQGSVLGDGTLPLSLPTGYFWARCISTHEGASTVANLVYFAVTASGDALHARCLEAARAKIAALALEGIEPSAIRVVKVPWVRSDTPLPAVLLSPLGSEQMTSHAGTNARDDVGYPVLVSIVAADNQDLTAHHARYLGWREQIARAMRHARLPGVAEIYTCHVEPEAIVLPEAFVQNLYHSALLLRFISREPRGG